MNKPINLITVIFLFLVAAMHLIRLIFHVEITVANTAVPQWASIIGFVVPAGLALLLRRESCR
jgi:hypothetical protein